MAFTTSAGGNSLPVKFGKIMWSPSKKHPEVPVPNVEFYDRETKAVSHAVQQGEYPSVQVSGKLVNFYVKSVPSYVDNQKQTGEENEYRGHITINDGSEIDALSFKILDASANMIDRRSLALLNSLHTHMKMVQSGELEEDAPIQIGLYRTQDKANPSVSYVNSIIRLPSGYNEEGQPLFTDSKNFVRNPEESRPPRSEPRLDGDGKPLVINGFTVYDHSQPIAWAERVIGELQTHYDAKRNKLAQTDSANEGQSQEGEDDVDLAEVAKAVAGERPRAAA